MEQYTINKIVVVGAGTMGSGIAQAAAQSGFAVILLEANEAVLLNAEQRIKDSINGLVAKQKINAEQAKDTLNNLQFTNDVNDGIGDLIVEAIVEKYDAKIGVLNQLAEINHSEVIFTSNTSSLSITKLQESVMHPQRVAGLHFFNPATIMRLVEVVQGEQTAHWVVKSLTAFVQQLNKTTVLCNDAPGFIVNRVARPYYIEALRMAEADIDLKLIDSCMEATGFKMGPFALMDLIGNDINLAVSKSVYEQLNNPQHLLPSFIQEQKVQDGHLGKKTGQGYYNYNNG
jgi:3-hydroxybutyryl-CoA dehydrogenase